MTLRTEKVASLIRREIGAMISLKYQGPEYGLVTVTEVRMTPDLKIAKVYVSILGSEEVKKNTLKQLELDRKAIRGYLGSNIRMKFTPEVQIYIDDTIDRMDKINRIINRIHSSEDES
jgi:ribosome-binding factor A